MKVVIRYGLFSKEFENKPQITIGKDANSDFQIKEIRLDKPVTLIYVEKYNNYVIVNPYENQEITMDNKAFSKTFVQKEFNIQYSDLTNPVEVSLVDEQPQVQAASANEVQSAANKTDNLSFEEVDQKRIKIVDEVRYRVLELKKSISQTTRIARILDAAIVVLSIVCSFAMTNLLLGLKVDSSTGVLNITTNYTFLICIGLIIFALAIVIQHACATFFKDGKQDGRENTTRNQATYFALGFFLVVYFINFIYYKDIPNFKVAALFVSLLFSGGLVAAVIAGGFIKKQLKLYRFNLSRIECRQDFESILKIYGKQINKYVNELSENKINNAKENLLNCQFRMIGEVILGIITAPFLAYGVSNTLASCFPEAAGWIRISGLRFSPIFLVLATFMIIFAFFSFVKAFAIDKQIKSSDVIKYDGFQDYKQHGVSILGSDAVRNLEKERTTVMIIACTIIAIEFTMNVSYFIGEMGSDIAGLLISSVAALVPTALLIAETHLLSSTTAKINNYNELLAMLD